MAVAAALLVPGERAVALDYEVALATSGAGELDEVVPRISALLRLAETAVPDAFTLVARARTDAERLEDAARSLGFYGAIVDIHVDGAPLQDPELLASLEAGDPQRKVAVDITIAAGPAYRLRRIAVEGVPPALSLTPELVAGAPARAKSVLDAEERLRERLREHGHAFARVPRREVTVDHDARAMDVVYHVEPGPRVELGEIRITGLSRTEPDYARRRLGLVSGSRFDSRAIEGARRGLAESGLFGSVRPRIAAEPDPQGRVPVVFEVVERPPRSLAFGAAYSTDEGASIDARWTHRNLFGRGESLRLLAEVKGLLHDNASDLGGRLDALLRKPDFLIDGLALRADIGAVRERENAYDRDAVYAGLGLERRLAEHLNGRLGAQIERSRVTQEGTARMYTLLGLPAALEWDSSNDRLEPSKGLRAEIVTTPTTALQEDSSGYIALRGSARTYVDLGPEAGRTVLALRGTLGTILAGERNDVPADRRFYAGGGGSVRGYAYQSIGPRDSGGNPLGGLSLAETSLELRQRIGEKWGAAVFVDAGGAAATRTLQRADLRAGIGAGVRYYTPIGALRFDIAVPLRADDETGHWQAYLGIGQAF